MHAEVLLPIYTMCVIFKNTTNCKNNNSQIEHKILVYEKCRYHIFYLFNK